jgi:hypothetical protein
MIQHAGQHLAVIGKELGVVRFARDGRPGSLCTGVRFSWRAIGVSVLRMLSVRCWGLGPVGESTG